MTTIGKSFTEVIDFVKKFKVVRKARQTKALAKRPKSIGSFQGFYSRGSSKLAIVARPVQSVMPASASKCNNNRGCLQGK